MMVLGVGTGRGVEQVVEHFDRLRVTVYNGKWNWNQYWSNRAWEDSQAGHSYVPSSKRSFERIQ